MLTVQSRELISVKFVRLGIGSFLQGHICKHLVRGTILCHQVSAGNLKDMFF